MSIDVGDAFRNGFEELAGPKGVVVGGMLLVLTLANLVVNQSLSLHVWRFVFEQVFDPEMVEELMTAFASSTPFALDVPLVALVVGTFLLLLVNELIRLVSIRLFGSQSSEPLPFDEVSEDFGQAALKALVLGGALSLAVFFLSLIPILGWAIAGGLMTAFVFLRQVIALEDRGFGATAKRSFSLFMDNPLQVVLILLVLGVASLVVGGGIGFVLGIVLPQMAATLVSSVIGVFFQTIGIAVVTDAYKQAAADYDGSGAHSAPASEGAAPAT